MGAIVHPVHSNLSSCSFCILGFHTMEDTSNSTELDVAVNSLQVVDLASVEVEMLATCDDEQLHAGVTARNMLRLACEHAVKVTKKLHRAERAQDVLNARLQLAYKVQANTNNTIRSLCRTLREGVGRIDKLKKQLHDQDNTYEQRMYAGACVFTPSDSG